jgi:hypothetical protein
MAYRVVDRLLLVVHHPSEAPAPAEWNAYVAGARSLLEKQGKLKTLVISGAAPPNSNQRSHYSSSIPGRNARLALVIGDRKVVPIAKVFAWFMPNVRVFSPGDLLRALMYLDVDPSPVLDEQLDELARSMGHVLARVIAQ